MNSLLCAAQYARILHGKSKAHFLGEVAAADLITGDALASAIGLTAGTAQHSNEPWLHFELDGKTLYVAKKPYRHTVSWDQLNTANVIYGDRTLVINGKNFKVRLLKGSATDPHVGEIEYDPVGAYGSEWNRLFYPLIPNPSNAPSNPSGEGLVYGSLADYTETELWLVFGAGDGTISWCQETTVSDSASRVIRGYFGVSILATVVASSVNELLGWRPVLELVD